MCIGVAEDATPNVGIFVRGVKIFTKRGVLVIIKDKGFMIEDMNCSDVCQ